jgi:predicted transglutaminase-like cysteine proteinase
MLSAHQIIRWAEQKIFGLLSGILFVSALLAGLTAPAFAIDYPAPARQTSSHFTNALPTAARLDTPLARRWAMTRKRIEAETAWLTSCSRGACRDPRAARWQVAVRLIAATPTSKRPVRVHRLINSRIRYVSDLRADDHWSTPLTTLLRGGGDCEDHALLKRALLLAAGTPESDLRLLILRTRRGGGHVALQVAEHDGLILDNRYRLPMQLSALSGDRIAAIATSRGYFSVN